ncbi:Oidioi.mRNA.OKI2018_I69.PAR.g9254.t1.cds [Oikopleura dioica]|uniref:Copper transport protein n=1 Tax=Oikopleura dioica TaxID=34765 RepID=A0ABN7RQ80_OIKDI|nr:Oidioi.mRNA.OKI2018_I69.PAR.g9254.t1.cds [Oikopleura dioica]
MENGMDMDGNMGENMDHTGHNMEDLSHGTGHFLAFNKILPIQGFIFKKWNVENTGDVAWTCVVIGILGFLVEFIKFGKAKIARKQNNSFGTSSKWLYALGSSLLHFVQITFGYILMLAVMTFHPGIFFAAVVGLTVGYFVFQAVLRSNSGTRDDGCCE